MKSKNQKKKNKLLMIIIIFSINLKVGNFMQLDKKSEVKGLPKSDFYKPSLWLPRRIGTQMDRVCLFHYHFLLRDVISS